MFFSKEDIEAWKEATRTVRKLFSGERDDPPVDEKKIVSRETIPIKIANVNKAKPVGRQYGYFFDINEGEAGRMDRNAFSRLKSGKMRPHMVEDLHGMNLADAREHFYELVQLAHASGKRCILLITGKGFEAPGKIRSALPSWINDDDLKPLILAYTHAQPKDGGKGAFYIYLSR